MEAVEPNVPSNHQVTAFIVVVGLVVSFVIGLGGFLYDRHESRQVALADLNAKISANAALQQADLKFRLDACIAKQGQ